MQPYSPKESSLELTIVGSYWLECFHYLVLLFWNFFTPTFRGLYFVGGGGGGGGWWWVVVGVDPLDPLDTGDPGDPGDPRDPGLLEVLEK